MEYIDVHEISKQWHMKERKVTSLCREGRIAGSKKIGKTWMIPSDSLKPLDKRTKDYDSFKLEIETNTSFIPYTEVGGEEKVISYYKEKYLKPPMYTAFTPYRICPIGAHVDHNLGHITGFAIDKGIHFAYSIKNNGIIELESLQYPKRAQWHVNNISSIKENDLFEEYPVIKDINLFKQESDIILANRMSDELDDIKQKVYTRDLYRKD